MDEKQREMLCPMLMQGCVAADRYPTGSAAACLGSECMWWQIGSADCALSCAADALMEIASSTNHDGTDAGKE